MRKQITLLCTTLALLLSSCIYEERGKCPTYLTLDLSETPDEVDCLYLVLEYEDGITFRDTIQREDFLPDYEIAVPRGTAQLATYGNISNMTYDNGYITPTGYPADNIYTYFSKGDLSSDLSKEKITLTKNYIAIHTKVLGQSRASESLRLTVDGNCIGYSNTGEIISGMFSHTPDCLHTPTREEDYYLFVSRVTRIKEGGSLSLSIFADSLPLLEISLLKKLEEAGIDMADNTLQDLYLTIDYSRSTITISVDNFNSTDKVDITF